MSIIALKLICLTSFLYSTYALRREAIANLESPTITGSITFTETAKGVMIIGIIVGLPKGKYGVHIHETGDTSSCESVGKHFNPYRFHHGGPEQAARHVGDLGNVEFLSNGVAIIDTVNSYVSLRGPSNVLGRAVVLHEREDDLGLGPSRKSRINGNVGRPLVCGVIGINSPVDAWKNY